MSSQRDAARRLDVALVGAGLHAYRTLLPALTFLPVRLRAICDVDLARARATAEQYGARAYASTRELYAAEALDAVLLAVGAEQHPALACEAFAAGLHVWLEKPPAATAADVLPMLEARGDRICVVGFKKAFMPATDKAVELFVDGPFGPVAAVLAVYGVTIPADGAQVLASRRPTGWLHNGCHPLSFVVTVAGPVAAVTTHRGGRTGVVCVLEHERGALSTLQLVPPTAGRVRPLERYTVFGESAHLVVDGVTRVTLHRGIPFDYAATTSFAPAGSDGGSVTWEPQQALSTLDNHSSFTHGIDAELRAFCDAVLGGTTPARGSLERAHHLMTIYEAALLSAGERVEVPARVGAPARRSPA